MIISHKYKFIFIKTAKTAGTSIEVFLSQYCGDKDILTPIHPHVEPHMAKNHRGFWNPLYEIVDSRGANISQTVRHLMQRKKFYHHIPANVVRNRIPSRIWNEYFKFCVERNPWDKTLSLYHMIKSKSRDNISFDEYLNSGNFCINFPKYTDKNEAVIVDKIIKYEALSDGLQQVFDSLGVPFDGLLGVSAKSSHRNDKRPYQEIYTARQKNIIQTAFKKEIDLHGYTF